MIFTSKEISETISIALKIAPQDVTVLIFGESGTGKELMASFIHNNSTRNEAAFVKINCSALPEHLLESELFGYEEGSFTGASVGGKIGLFEVAHRGTLFLDEIGTLPLHLQPKLLRAIQEKEILKIGAKKCIPIDVRIIAATNENLVNAVEVGLFREDLYYRLNVIPLFIPPLRERKKDIPVLALHFLEMYNKKYGMEKEISPESLKSLENHSWPGNIRELENLIERLVVVGNQNNITFPHFFPDFPIEEPMVGTLNVGLKQIMADYEKYIISLHIPYFNKSQDLANFMKIDKSTLIRKMKRYGIKNIYM